MLRMFVQEWWFDPAVPAGPDGLDGHQRAETPQVRPTLASFTVCYWKSFIKSINTNSEEQYSHG